MQSNVGKWVSTVDTTYVDRLENSTYIGRSYDHRHTALYSTCCICTRYRLLLHSTATTNLNVPSHRSDSQRQLDWHDCSMMSSVVV